MTPLSAVQATNRSSHVFSSTLDVPQKDEVRAVVNDVENVPQLEIEVELVVVSAFLSS